MRVRALSPHPTDLPLTACRDPEPYPRARQVLGRGRQERGSGSLVRLPKVLSITTMPLSFCEPRCDVSGKEGRIVSTLSGCQELAKVQRTTSEPFTRSVDGVAISGRCVHFYVGTGTRALDCGGRTLCLFVLEWRRLGSMNSRRVHVHARRTRTWTWTRRHSSKATARMHKSTIVRGHRYRSSPRTSRGAGWVMLVQLEARMNK